MVRVIIMSKEVAFHDQQFESIMDICSFSPLICINNGYLKSVNQDSQMDIWERECMEFIGIGEAELYDKHNQGFLSDKADNPISNLALAKPGDATDGAVKR
nr:hypothetical protein Iba_chr01bCG7280 [Ipomoea batatas]